MKFKTIKHIVLVFSLFLFTSCQAQDCSKTNLQFNKYKEALEKVRQIDFNISEKVQTRKSSWISQIEYYSCDEVTGFLLMTTKKGKTYIHKDVPLAVWNSFKNAPSFGKFYTSNVKGKYQF